VTIIQAGYKANTVLYISENSTRHYDGRCRK